MRLKYVVAKQVFGFDETETAKFVPIAYIIAVRMGLLIMGLWLHIYQIYQN